MIFNYLILIRYVVVTAIYIFTLLLEQFDINTDFKNQFLKIFVHQIKNVSKVVVV